MRQEIKRQAEERSKASCGGGQDKGPVNLPVGARELFWAGFRDQGRCMGF